jgi:hypothetical protein
LFRPSADGCDVGDESISLREAVFWLNLHLELLAGNQRALRRMRDLVAMSPMQPTEFQPDFQLLSDDAERLLSRVVHWENVVDMSSRVARLRPILAGLGLKP